MRTLAAHDVLDSVVEITQEQDCEQFRRSLSGTVRELMALDEIIFAGAAISSTGATIWRELYRETRREPLGDEPPLVRAVLPEGLIDAARVRDMQQTGYSLAMQGGSALLLLPILQRESLAEVVILRAEAFSGATLSMLEGFIRLYRNFRSLIVESERDALTGLLNRRTLEKRLRIVLRQAHQRLPLVQAPGSQRSSGEIHDYLAVMDIDHFKRINDTLGHLFGDEVLILVSRLMRESFRDEDVLFRFGGEEFVVILLAHSAEGARIALDRFREVVAGHRFPQLDRVTISIGLTRIRDGDVAAAMVGRADQALYYAKEHGRNMVCDADLLAANKALQQAAPVQEVELF